MLKKQRNSRGMSYVEVAICLFIVSISILPLSQAFVTSVKIREEAETMSQTTFYVETLLEETKGQLEKDLIEARKIQQGHIAADELAYYLNKTLPEQTRIDPTHFKDFLKNAADTEQYLNQKYDTSRYSYEVAVWNVKNISETDNKVAISSELLHKAVKFYTDVEYKFSSSDLENLPKFTIDEQYKELFTDEIFLKKFIPRAIDNNSSVVGVSILDLKMGAGGEISSIGAGNDTTITQIGGLKLEQVSTIETGPEGIKGYVYNIKEGVTDSTTSSTGVIVLDTRSLNRTKVKNTILKFNNETKLPINLKIIINKEDLGEIDKKLHIMIMDNNDIDKKTTVERITHFDREDSYLIAVIVRDKAPRLGNKGKIVKTMVDTYTFKSLDN